MARLNRVYEAGKKEDILYFLLSPRYSQKLPYLWLFKQVNVGTWVKVRLHAFY